MSLELRGWLVELRGVWGWLQECGQDKVAVQQRVLNSEDGWPGQVMSPGKGQGPSAPGTPQPYPFPS